MTPRSSCTTPTGAELVALLTRDRFEELELWRGQTVWVRPQRERVLAQY